MLIDSHAHISYFEKHQQKSIIENAFQIGVGLIVNISTEVKKFEELSASCHHFSNIFLSIGTHPCHVHEEPHIEKSHLLNIAKNNEKVVAIGETGLDYFHETTHKILQIEKFQNHIEVASHLNFPVIVHTREADGDTLKILTEARKAYPNLKVLIHCFTGGEEFCKQLLEIGCYISFSGIVTFKNAKEVQKSMMSTPLNRILLETDSPFLAPHPHRGKQNQPAFVKHVYDFISSQRQISSLQLEEIVLENFKNLFKIDENSHKLP